MKQLFIDNCLSKDVVPILYGHEKCAPAHSFGPFSRNFYLIHFCLNGCGKLFDKFGEHNISAGQMFIIRPKEITTYVADNLQPWEYCWIAFDGNIANVFNTNQSVYPFQKEISQELLTLVQNQETVPSVFISLIYKLIYKTFALKSTPVDLTDKIIQYIDFNYAQSDLSVEKLSSIFGYEQSYLFKIFKKRVGLGIKQYIIKCRMEQAKVLLENGNSVLDTAFAVGYKDQFCFSKAFKKFFNLAPIQVKNNFI